MGDTHVATLVVDEALAERELQDEGAVPIRPKPEEQDQQSKQ